MIIYDESWVGRQACAWPGCPSDADFPDHLCVHHREAFDLRGEELAEAKQESKA